MEGTDFSGMVSNIKNLCSDSRDSKHRDFWIFQSDTGSTYFRRNLQETHS